jgi:hypothetical protein
LAVTDWYRDVQSVRRAVDDVKGETDRVQNKDRADGVGGDGGGGWGRDADAPRVGHAGAAARARRSDRRSTAPVGLVVMGVRISDTSMSCDGSGHTATLVDESWQVSWLPGRTLDRNGAITALTLADIYAANPPPGDRDWLLAADFERELGIDSRFRP